MANLADQFIEAHGYSAFSKDIQVFQLKILLPKHREETTKVPIRRTDRDPIHNRVTVSINQCVVIVNLIFYSRKCSVMHHTTAPVLVTVHLKKRIYSLDRFAY